MTFKVTKDPSEVLDYSIDYSRPFNATTPVDSILASTWAIEKNSTTDPLVIDSNTFDATHATVWLSGGRKGYKYKVTNHIETNSTPKREYERTIEVKLDDK